MFRDSQVDVDLTAVELILCFVVLLYFLSKEKYCKSTLCNL